MSYHCYIIIYESVSGLDASTFLFDLVKQYHYWARLTDSSWAVVSDEDSSVIRDNLKSVVSSSDRLYVIRSGQMASWMNSRPSNDWLQKNIVK